VRPPACRAAAAPVRLPPTEVIVKTDDDCGMHYPGGKGKTYQHIINLMPRHDVYIETHLGGGSVMRKKKPAAVNIGVERDAAVLASWRQMGVPNLELVHGRAEDFLSAYPFKGDEVVYADPPYLPELRRRPKLYRCEYTTQDHVALLKILVQLPCKVLVSGYPSALYDRMLPAWNQWRFLSKTQVDVREEVVWFNFEVPPQLHDSQYLGDTFRDRQSTKRRMDRLKSKVLAMEPRERAAFGTWFNDTFPDRDPLHRTRA
jgi:DNA adenine methylase